MSKAGPGEEPLISGHVYQSDGPVNSVPIGQGDRILIADWSDRALTTRWGQARSLRAGLWSVGITDNQAAQFSLLLLVRQTESSSVIGQSETKNIVARLLIPLSRLNDKCAGNRINRRLLEGSRKYC